MSHELLNDIHCRVQVKGFPEIKVFYNGHIGLSMRGAAFLWLHRLPCRINN